MMHWKSAFQPASLVRIMVRFSFRRSTDVTTSTQITDGGGVQTLHPRVGLGCCLMNSFVMSIWVKPNSNKTTRLSETSSVDHRVVTREATTLLLLDLLLSVFFSVSSDLPGEPQPDRRGPLLPPQTDSGPLHPDQAHLLGARHLHALRDLRLQDVRYQLSRHFLFVLFSHSHSYISWIFFFLSLLTLSVTAGFVQV